MDIGELTGDWDYSTLPPNVRVGEGCFIERKESFGRFRSENNPGLVIGDGVRVYTWTAFTVEPGGYIEIGDNSTLVGAVFWCAERIVVGRRVVVSHNVMIADSDFHPREPSLRREDATALAPDGSGGERPPLVAEPVFIGDDARIGIGAIILKGARVGAGARIGAGAVVTSDVPPGASVAGNPARIIGGGSA